MDKKERVHDFALAAASISATKNFRVEAVPKDDPDQARKNFARCLLDEYNYLFSTSILILKTSN